MITLAIYPLMITALYYLGAWARVTRCLWSRYPAPVAALMMCASCSGFYYGACVATVCGYGLGLPFGGLPGDAWSTPLIVGLCSIVWTPPIARLLLESNERLGGGHAEVEEPERALLASDQSR